MKEVLARAIRWPIVRHLLQLAVRLFAPRHRVGVIAIVFNDDNEVLLLEHVFHPTMPWGAPGGWLSPREDPENGALRELYEETGLRGTVAAILLADSDVKPPHLTIAFLVRAKPEPFKLSNEILQAQWFAPTDLPPLYPVVEKAIAQGAKVAAANNSRKSTLI